MSSSTWKEQFQFGSSIKRPPILHFSSQRQLYIQDLRERRSRMAAPIYKRFDESGNAIVVDHHVRHEAAQDESADDEAAEHELAEDEVAEDELTEDEGDPHLLRISCQHQAYIKDLRKRRLRMAAPIHQRFDNSGNAVVINHHARNEAAEDEPAEDEPTDDELAEDEGDHNLQNIGDIVTIQESYKRYLTWIGARTEADLQEVFEAAGGQLTMTDLQSIAPMIVLSYIYDDPLRKRPVAGWTVQYLYDFLEWIFIVEDDSWGPARRPECPYPIEAPKRPQAYIGAFVKDFKTPRGVVKRWRRIGYPVFIRVGAKSENGMPSHRYVDCRGKRVAREDFEAINGDDTAEEAARMALSYDARKKEYTEQHNRQLIVFAARWIIHQNHVRPRRRLALRAAMDRPPLTLTELKMKLYPFSKRQ